MTDDDLKAGRAAATTAVSRLAASLHLDDPEIAQRHAEICFRMMVDCLLTAQIAFATQEARETYFLGLASLYERNAPKDRPRMNG